MTYEKANMRKEPVIERIAQLVKKHTSRSAAARAWEINISTLNSYFKNKASLPMPRENLLQRIADSEGVSLEWLMFGTGESPKLPKVSAKENNDDGLINILSFLTSEERQQLTALLARKGVETLVPLLMEFAHLSPSELERVVRLSKQIREGASDCSEEGDLTSPTRQSASRA